jgi:drug/metabolite transporter (DMT)-like permease
MSPEPNAAPRAAWAAWIVVCLVWGTTYLAIRIALETLPPFLMAAFRWTVAGAIILVVMKIRGDRLPSASQWPGLAVLGVLLMGFGNGGVVWAEQTIPSGLAAVLVAVIPFWMVGVEKLMGDAPPLNLRRSIGLAIGFIGIVLLVWPDIQFGGDRGFLGGVLATQLACLGWAIGSSYSRRRGADENVLAAAALQMMLGGLCMFVVVAIRGEWSSLAFSTRSVSALIYLILFGSIAGFLAYAYALKHLPVATVSLYAYVNPVIAVLLGTAVLEEPLSPRLALSGGIVLAGMALVRQSPKTKIGRV